jgi:hypothetical protein
VNTWKWLLKPISEKSKAIREKGRIQDARRAGVIIGETNGNNKNNKTKPHRSIRGD